MSSTGIVFIVLIACVTGVIMQWLSDKKERRKAEGNGEEFNETLEQLRAIEERVRVLERIVTENKFDLKREIDRL